MLQDRPEGLHPHVIALGREQHLAHPVLAAEIVVWVVVPKQVDQALDLLAPLHLARRVMLHGGVGQEAVEVTLLVADIQRPGVTGDQVVDVQPVFDRDLGLHGSCLMVSCFVRPA